MIVGKIRITRMLYGPRVIITRAFGDFSTLDIYYDARNKILSAYDISIKMLL